MFDIVVVLIPSTGASSGAAREWIRPRHSGASTPAAGRGGAPGKPTGSAEFTRRCCAAATRRRGASSFCVGLGGFSEVRFPEGHLGTSESPKIDLYHRRSHATSVTCAAMDRPGWKIECDTCRRSSGLYIRFGWEWRGVETSNVSCFTSSRSA